MTTDLDIADVLEKAADDIATNGLAKHILENKAGQHCAIGAIGLALGATFEEGDFSFEGEPDCALIEAAAIALLPHILTLDHPWHWSAWDYGQRAWNGVVRWNNDPNRTADEVVEAMRQAAKDLRNEATPWT